MVFNSLEFAIFLPIVYLIYNAIYRKERVRDVFLLIASYLFYMSWYWQYAGLIAISTIVDYVVGARMSKSTNMRTRRVLLTVSLTVNLGLLALFKYFNFFAELSAQTIGFFGIDMPPIAHELLLPVGISFYTFQTLSYTIDIYRGELEPEPRLTKFAVFVAFFPQLVAGPIVRAKTFLPQINRICKPSYDGLEGGLALIFSGLFKKIVIADLLAFLAVDRVFENPLAYSSWDLLMALYGYAIQIYCDFSGYSDIAIGCALILGFQLPKNFNRPYVSQSPSEFWQRWHISLSSWLRDYLYIPLGGNRGKAVFVLRNLMITMLLGGLWHGAALHFVYWGAYHGLLLAVFRPFSTTSSDILVRTLRVLLMFHLTVFGWLLFRAPDMSTFWTYFRGLSDVSGGTVLQPLFYALLAIGFLMHFIPKSAVTTSFKTLVPNWPMPVKAGVYAGLILVFVGASLVEPNFIYFQF